MSLAASAFISSHCQMGNIVAEAGFVELQKMNTFFSSPSSYAQVLSPDSESSSTCIFCCLLVFAAGTVED